MSPRANSLSGADLEAVSALVADAQSAQSDTPKLLSLHAPGTVIVNIAGRRVLGRDAFGDAMTAALASPLKDVRTEVTIDDVRAANRDTVVVSCTKVVRDGRPTSDVQGAIPTVGALTYVMTRTESSWEIVLAQTTPVAAV